LPIVPAAMNRSVCLDFICFPHRANPRGTVSFDKCV
jgi:hypothetical protein